jgi:hypothetical protein
MVSMNHCRHLCLSALLGLAIGLSVGESTADGRYPDLQKGSTIGSVFAQWGEPTEKIERELKSQVVWYYPNGAYVLFQGGKVIRWRSPVGGSGQEVARPTPKITAPPISTLAIDSATRDLVRDIAREVPSSPDSPYTEPPPQPPAPVQVAPGGGVETQQRGLPQPPPGLAPGNPILPFDEDVGEE